ncbi:hypothetical protein B0T24DRAFT_157377 [Lasiosphaeria ovina]|uniref:WSC domain-containing protein n=1 Tax=Lasiosphaeria ovina TaxID=92902 RepID=A0AAE0KML5_9PEZI|nr:hypothetical protein B0T24DRAFT_157377 [Lasiosphaeria ovina]
MRFSLALVVLATSVVAVKDKTKRTFAVLHHYGKGPLTTCRADPIINPGVPSSHTHMIMGASNFGFNATGESLRQSRCTTALPKADLSAYWVPQLYFKDPIDGHFESVKMDYMNVYYFFEASNDDIKAFPVGLQMISGNAALRTPPRTTDVSNIDPSKGAVSPAAITCPRSGYNPPSWLPGSDGTTSGIQNGNNNGEGIGFPLQDCDGLYSPMRTDLHFPSCYNPQAGLTNYKTNMQFPVGVSGGKNDCPAGWIHVPQLFYEIYWNTHDFAPRFKDLLGKESPFVFANGDVTGYSMHGDFIAGWDEAALQQVIDNCDAGTAGFDKCPGLMGGLNDRSTSCNIDCPLTEQVLGSMAKLPGNNPLSGYKYGTGASSGSSGAGAPASQPQASSPPKQSPPAQTSSSSKAAAAPVKSSSSKAAASPTKSATPTTLVSQPVVKTKALSTPPAAATTTVKALPVPTGGITNPNKPNTPGAGVTTTVLDTTTVWMTTTAYGKDGGAAPTGAPASGSQPDVAGFKYAGCFKDGQTRTLSGEIRPNLGKISNTNCVTYCTSKGFKVAGTEYGGQCYCGNTLAGSAKLAESACSMKCEGAAGQTCGGSWALSVYTKDGTIPSAPAKRHLRNHVHHRSNPIYRR